MRYLRIAAVAAFLLSPLGVVSLALAGHHATLADVRPSWNDDVNYWNEIACFVRAGFGGGYCVVDERTAAAPWTRFGPHGPAFPVLYGLPARLVGWYPTSGSFFNVVVTALAAGLWVWLARPDLKQLAVATALIASFWPAILSLPSTYQDSLHFAIAFVLAGLAQRALRQDVSLRSSWPLVVAVVLASFVRLTWILVLVPWAAIAFPGKRWYSRCLILLSIVCLVPVATCVWGAICSPYDDALSNWIAQVRDYPTSTFWTLLWQWNRECVAYFDRTMAPTVSMLLRYQIVALFVIAAGLLLRRTYPRATAFAALNVLVVLVPTILIYGTRDWHDYRVVAPHVLLALLVLLSADYRIVLPFVAANLLFVGPFLGQFSDWTRPRLRADVAAPFREAIAPFVEYNPAAGPWRNTMLVPVDLWSVTLEGLPPGVGATMLYHEERLKHPLRSRWVLLHGQPPGQYGRLKSVAEVPVDADPPVAQLYENLDCTDGT
jgi:hypothetical protein